MTATEARLLTDKANGEKLQSELKMVVEAVEKAAASGECCATCELADEAKPLMARTLALRGFSVISSEKTIEVRW